jgi:hypothetical protein
LVGWGWDHSSVVEPSPCMCKTPHKQTSKQRFGYSYPISHTSFLHVHGQSILIGEDFPFFKKYCSCYPKTVSSFIFRIFIPLGKCLVFSIGIPTFRYDSLFFKCHCCGVNWFHICCVIYGKAFTLAS